MSLLIDTHAHLYVKQYNRDRNETIQRAKKNLSHIFLPNIDSTTIRDMHALSDAYPDFCFPMMGIHPCYIKNDFEKQLKVAEEWLSKRKYYAIGEIGTDLYHDKTFIEQQKEALQIQIDWAKKYSLPIVIHCRDSFDLAMNIIEKNQDGTLNGVIHCFGGMVEEAYRIEDVGFYMGIGGVVTYKSSVLRDTLRIIGLDRIVLETDCPYLTPLQYKGKRNEPSYVSIVAETVANAVGCSYKEVATETTNNALNLFKL